MSDKLPNIEIMRLIARRYEELIAEALFSQSTPGGIALTLGLDEGNEDEDHA